MGKRLWVIAMVIASIVSACGGGQTGGSPAPSATPTIAAKKVGSAKIAIGGAWNVGYLPTAVAIDRLNAMGYKFDPVIIATPQAMSQAAAQGDIDIGTVGPGDFFAAADGGLDAKMFFGFQNNSFVLVAKKELTTCKSLDGKRVAVQSLASTTNALLNAFIAKECPGTKPNVMIVAGSDNRLAGLLQNQLDATPLDLQSLVLLQKDHAADYVVIPGFIDVPVVGGVFYAKPTWLAQNKDMALDLIRVYLGVLKDAAKDPSILVTKGNDLVKGVDLSLMPAIVKAWQDAKVFPIDGDLNADQMKFTYDFFNATGNYKKLTGATPLIDRTYLDTVLKETK
jgi:ABC-type nitrate/sulfonate/bicarbonate transport system substrate-binding protein